ncbi:uncharacterized protein [Amphiura filiformis]|uniref:uncharacterized protein isoform X2 n=1 Tax=Amphiura filiformis TaxID=82378 RepID=UPI003B2262A0
MRSQGVLSMEDCQEMLVSSLYPTDRQRASHFLDVITTKGQRGYNAFLDCLDEHYPHVYKTVTGKEPSPRPHMPMSPSVFNFSEGFGTLLSEISNHNHQLQQDNNEKTYSLDKLQDENIDLANQNATYMEKLKNYQIVLKNYKQLEIDHRDLKDELLDLYISLHQTEKDKEKYKALSKQKSEKVHEYEEKLKRITNLLNSQRNSLERTSSKNEKLSQEKNQLQKEISHIKMEMEKVHRQSTISCASYTESIELDKDTMIEIYKQDKETALRDYEDVNSQLYEARQEIDSKDMKVDKLEAENKDLKFTIEMIQKDLSATERNYQLMWQELQISNRDANNALEQRNQSQAELQMIRKETEQRQFMLQEELMKYKGELHSNPQDNMVDGDGLSISPLMIAMSRKPVRGSYMSSSSGVSSGRDSLEITLGDTAETTKAVTLPRPAPPVSLKPRPSLPSKPKSSAIDDNDDIQPISRSRLYPIVQREDSTTKLEHDTFPQSEIPLSDTPAETKTDDGAVCKSGRQGFVDRPEIFSESMQARHGSQRKSREFYEAQDCMLDEMRKSVFDLDRSRTHKKHAKLGTYDDFLPLDYDDESEELARIMRTDRLTMKPYKPRESSPVETSNSRSASIKPPVTTKKPSTKKPSTEKQVPNGPPNGATMIGGIQPHGRHSSLPNNAIPSQNGCISALVSATVSPTVNSWHERSPRQISRKRLGARKSNSEDKPD